MVSRPDDLVSQVCVRLSGLNVWVYFIDCLKDPGEAVGELEHPGQG